MSKPIGRPKKEEIWNQVTKEENGKWKCKYCGHQFSGKISVTRIRAHLYKETGHGTAPCSFHRDIYEGAHNNLSSSSSNPQEHVNTLGSIQVAEGVPERIEANAIISSSNNRDNNIDYGGNTFEPETTLLNQLVSNLQRDKSDIEGQVQLLQCLGKKRKRGVDIWLHNVEELRKRADELNNALHPQPEINGGEIKRLIGEIQGHKEEVPLVLSTEIVGKNFEENMKKMWKFLFDDQVFIIGVYGMGGVGKTLLATHLENEIKRKGSFKDVFWVTVSHNFSTSKLQHDISKRMGVKLDEDDEKIRAEILSTALETKEKPILILDDVWKYIDLEKVGIRRNLNGIKVILTTRLKHVCQQMDCLPNNMIQMLPLDYYDAEDEEAEFEEAEELFKVKLGHSGTPATLPPEVEEIARRIVEGCGGLPLGISVMARTLKGSINDIHRWKYALNKLEKMEMEQEVEEEVFKVLKRSYDNLVEKDMQNCFLYCALFPYFRRHELIVKLLNIGLLEGRRSLEEIFCEGNNILDKLIDHSLLQEGKFSGFYASPFVRVMASNILKESQRCVNFLKEKAYFQKELTIQEWKDLKFVNLMIYRDVEEIPEDMSPHCPQLSTLIIRPHLSNKGINYFPNCFFKDMKALTVLDLSGNSELKSLPESLSDLRSLVSLSLRKCYLLKYVPPLEKLQALSRLDISHCSIEQVPQGLEKIIKLKWLDLSYNGNLIMEPGFVDVLPNLTSMQYLDLRGCPDVKIKVEDVQGMNRLECLGGTFLDSKHYNRYMEILLDQSFGPKTYRLSLEKSYDWEHYEYPMLPNNQRDFHLHDNNQWICLCGALSSKAASSLNKIQVYNCKQLESVFCLSGSCFVCIDFCKLKRLYLKNLGSLTVIYKVDVVDVRQSLSMRNKFPCLTYLHISGCHEIKKLLTPRLVLQLPNLERITVKDCNSIEEIIAVGNGGDNDGSSITLPKLTTLELCYLPQLRTVCNEDVVDVRQSLSMRNKSPCLTHLHISGCDEIKKLLTPSLVLQLPNLESITVSECNSMEEIIAVGNGGDNDGSSITLPKLTRLILYGLPQLKAVCNEDVVDFRQSLSMRNKFPCLTYLHISRCHEIKKLLTPWLVLQLPNLESITVKYCNSMEEIIAVGDGGDNDGSSITLPKLTTLELCYLPQLRTVCKGSIIFGSSPTLTIERCPNLKWNHPAFPLQVDSYGNNF